MGLTDTRKTENPEPRTEAGKSLYRGMLARYHEGSIGRLVVTDDWLPTILAIEAEAAADGMTHMVEKRVAKREAEAAQGAAPRAEGLPHKADCPLLAAGIEHEGFCPTDEQWRIRAAPLHPQGIEQEFDRGYRIGFSEGAAPLTVDDIAGDLWHQREGWHATEGAAPRDEGHEHSFVLQQGATCRCGAAAPRAEGLDVLADETHEVRSGLMAAAGHLAKHGCNVYHEDGPCQWQRLSPRSPESDEAR